MSAFKTDIDYAKLPTTVQAQLEKLDPTPTDKKLTTADLATLNSAQQADLQKIMDGLTADQRKLAGLVEAPTQAPPINTGKPRTIKIDGLGSAAKDWDKVKGWDLDRSLLPSKDTYDTAANATRTDSGIRGSGSRPLGPWN